MNLDGLDGIVTSMYKCENVLFLCCTKWSMQIVTGRPMKNCMIHNTEPRSLAHGQMNMESHTFSEFQKHMCFF